MHGRMALLFFGLSLILAGVAPEVAGQVLGQPYRLSDKEVEQIIRRVEKQADIFHKDLRDALKHNGYERTRREDDINAYVKGFYEDTARLHDRFNNHKSASADVEAVLDRAARIDEVMRRDPLSERVQDDWSALRGNLDELAQAYNVAWRWGGYPRISPTASETPYRLSDKEVEQIIRRVEKQSDSFRSSLRSALKKGRYKRIEREDQINAYVKEFYQETKRLRDHFDDHKSTGADVQSVLDRAARIDDFMRRYRLTSDAQNDWANLRANLDELARTYNVTWRWGY